MSPTSLSISPSDIVDVFAYYYAPKDIYIIHSKILSINRRKFVAFYVTPILEECVLHNAKRPFSYSKLNREEHEMEFVPLRSFLPNVIVAPINSDHKRQTVIDGFTRFSRVER